MAGRPQPAGRCVEVTTSVGTARVYVAAAADPRATLVLGTGASGNVEAVDLSLLPRQLPSRGVSVVRVEQPWHVAGGKMASRPPVLDAGWRDVLVALCRAPTFAGLAAADRPLYVGGRSNGARVACRTAAATGAVGPPPVGVVCFAFPLHPPGRPGQTRLPELLAADVPRLVFQGERDAFGTAEQLVVELAGAPGVQVQPVPFADHSMRTAKAAPYTATDVAELLIHRTLAFCTAPVPDADPRNRAAPEE
ncbi:MAG: alpha/beta hydrolase family protein [Propionibacteriaceae bacterium]